LIFLNIVERLDREGRGQVGLRGGFNGLGGGFSVTEHAENHVVTDLQGVDVEKSLGGRDESEVDYMSERPEL